MNNNDFPQQPFSIEEVEQEKAAFRKRLNQLIKEPCLSEKTSLADKQLLPLPDYEIQLFLRDTAVNLLARALAGASGKLLAKIFRNMGDRGAMILLEEIDFYRKLSPGEIREAQEKLIPPVQKNKELQ